MTLRTNGILRAAENQKRDPTAFFAEAVENFAEEDGEEADEEDEDK